MATLSAMIAKVIGKVKPVSTYYRREDNASRQWRDVANSSAVKRIYETLADVNSASAGAVDAVELSIPANFLNANGQALRIRAFGTTAANENNKTVAITFDGTTLLTTGALAANNKNWDLDVTIYRVGATAQRVIGRGVANDALVATGYSALTKNLATALALKVVLTGPTTNADVVLKGCTVELLDVNQVTG